MAIAAIVAGLLFASAQASYEPPRDIHGPSPKYPSPRLFTNYTSVPGYFLQDDATTNATTFDYTANNFGLINRTYKITSCGTEAHLSQWQKFEHEVLRSQREAPHNVDYKVIWFGRHAEGFHNAEESAVGTPAWNCYYAELNGNSTVTWSDAHLTAVGVQSALVANKFWRHEIEVEKIHPPDSFYTSPLFRCLQTANLTFNGLPLQKHSKFTPTVKELLREGVSIHTCDRRSNATYIQHSFPSYRLESSFSLHDPLWTGVVGETPSSQDVRSRTVLNDIFAHDHNTYISVTSHSGEIASILRVLNHRAFSLSPGAVIPVLVKAETISDRKKVSTTTTQPWTTSAHCTASPITSVANGGPCICPNGAAPVTTPLVPTKLP